ncbi:alpha/beta hydrolase family protein [Actinocatenispora thailandica]|uniref:alpha/beta hydrolase family protein n=1 Tax=Actinocatenispora thailandica TaxID=227318 RepID=UPI00194E4CB7|nr:alpha/beta hydrolase [Actinocatenispora thailandica]
MSGRASRSLARRAIGAVALAGLLGPVAVAPAATATAAPAHQFDGGGALALPAPTGRYPVGVDRIDLVDAGRTDPWVPSAGPRRLKVTLRYPTAHRHGGPAPYLGAAESAALLTADHLTAVPPDALSHVRTHSYAGTAPLPGRRPLVVLSPGFTQPAATLTAVAEDLASRGYLVAAVDHRYESVATTYPGGQLDTCEACGAAGSDVVASRVADIRFVLDELTGRQPAWRWARRIDASRIALVGHSVGGATASAAMAADRRIDAGINMDGTPHVPAPAGGLHRPFLLFGSSAHHLPGDDGKWDALAGKLTGWHRWLTVTGSEHFTFTDLTLLNDQLGLPPLAAVGGARSVRLTRRYVAAFVDRQLRGRYEPILDHPNPADPEIVFHR